MNKVIKTGISFFLKAFHVALCLFALIGPYITNNAFYLSLFILYYVSVLTLWHIFGNCFITNIENMLDGKTESKESYVTNLFTLVLGKYTRLVFSLVPIINTIVCLYKINRKVRQ